ncbi:phosphatidic acid phosphatase [Rhodoferax koreense]|uniref:Phosphatidic acid phosphatase n=1 Tax=Rhodoferax koreensis TaxID=1842727 RepID=A0A1P8JUW5_9BURK|nr:phosphatase PAP2 family protein [Rhodoferax koreense]APW37535.1 phosphatidic acid phosphatase [Rhodoferax koreense]
MLRSPTSRLSPIACLTVLAGLAVLAWDFSGLDLPLARWSGGPGGFPLQDEWFLTRVLHDGVRHLAWVLALLLCLGVWFPAGWLGRLGFRRRLQLAVTTLVAVSLVTLARVTSHASCPWSLAEFGGVAHYVSHWSGWFVTDGGSGACFPAGHAAAGFAFVGGYFAFRHEAPGLARRWLATSLLVGLVLGVSQQMRGAHFMSHTLWTGWLCWCAAWAVDALMPRLKLGQLPGDLGEVA